MLKLQVWTAELDCRSKSSLALQAMTARTLNWKLGLPDWTVGWDCRLGMQAYTEDMYFRLGLQEPEI